MNVNSLKANTPEASSDAIVVSFEGHWLGALRNGDISLVLRKRGPRTLVPHWIYVYVGAPHSLMLGRFGILKYEQLSVSAALARSTEAGLTKAALAKYLSKYETVAAFTVGDIALSPAPVSLATLQAEFSFSPPQSFSVLSRDGQRLLDHALSLPVGTARRGA